MLPNQSTKPAASALAKGAGALKPGTSSPEPGEILEADGKGSVTLEQLEAHKTEVQGMLARQYQGIQGLLDRQSGQLKAAVEPVNRMVAALKAQGIELTGAQIESLKMGEQMSAMSREPEAEPTEQVDGDGQPIAQGAQTGLSLGQLAVAMMQERGVVILKDDEEYKVVDQKTKDPQVFMASVDKAIKAKVRRLAGLEPEADDGANGEPPVLPKGGPKLNPKGKGVKAGGKILPEQMPSGRNTTSQDFLTAGYEADPKFQ